tara:strand:+ start:182 stop:352 length:171 start_codon:yes stop_codon:yes gene_type:complete
MINKIKAWLIDFAEGLSAGPGKKHKPLTFLEALGVYFSVFFFMLCLLAIMWLSLAM